jgi:23S rRNA (adenine2503-C2)-methyltransferase
MNARPLANAAPVSAESPEQASAKAIEIATSATTAEASNPTPVNLFNFSLPGMEQYFSGLGEKPFRARQVLKWIYHHGITDFNEMTNLSAKLRDQLNANAVLRPPTVINEHTSADGTVKWLMG